MSLGNISDINLSALTGSIWGWVIGAINYWWLAIFELVDHDGDKIFY